MKLDDDCAAMIAPLLRDAAAARMRRMELVTQIAALVADGNVREKERAELVIGEFVDGLAADFATAEGIGLDDVDGLFQELSKRRQFGAGE